MRYPVIAGSVPERRRLRDSGITARNVPRSRSHNVTEGAMKSAFECLENAAKCEEMARATKDNFDGRMLLETASHWRGLAQAALARERASPRLLKDLDTP